MKNGEAGQKGPANADKKEIRYYNGSAGRVSPPLRRGQAGALAVLKESQNILAGRGGWMKAGLQD